MFRLDRNSMIIAVVLAIVFIEAVKAVSPSPAHLVDLAVSSLNSGAYDKLISFGESKSTEQFKGKRFEDVKKLPEWLRPGKIMGYDVGVDASGETYHRYRVHLRASDGKDYILIVFVVPVPKGLGPNGWAIRFSKGTEGKDDVFVL